MSQTPSNGDNGPALDNGPGVGALLRAARLRIGEDLRDIADMLRIRYFYLEAIEEGRYADLPGPTYAVGFVRAYAENLGLDSTEVVRRFKTEAADVQLRADLRFPSPIPEGGVPGGAMLFVGSVIALLAYGGWYLSTTQNIILAEIVPPLPERLTDNATTGSGSAKVSNDATQATAAPAERIDTAGDDPTPTPAAGSTTTAAPEQSVAGSAVREAARNSTDPQGQNGVRSSTEDVATTGQAATTAPATTGNWEFSGDRRSGASETQGTSSDAGPAATETATGSDVATPVGASGPAAAAESATRPAAAAPITETAATAAEAQPSVSPVTTDTATATTGSSSSPTTADSTAEAAATGNSDAPAAAETVSAPIPTSNAAAPADDASSPETADNSPTPATADDAEPSSDVSASVGSAESDRQLAAAIANVDTSAANAPATSRIVVQARTASWIQVRDDAANRLLLTRLMRPGDVYKVPDRPGLTLLTGNAGALEILVDGEAVPSLGPAGLVRRDVALDAERLRAGTAVSN